MNSNNNIAKGAIISYISIFLNIIISFIYTPWMIRQIGVSDYGLYSLITSFVSYFLLDFGLDSAITRFIAKYRAEGDERKVENMLGLTTKVYLLIDAIIFFALIVLFFHISGIFKGLTPEEIEKMKLLYCIAGGFSVLNFVLKPMSGAMMAFEMFVENKLLDMVTRVGTVLLIVVALIFSANVYWLVLINGATAFCVSLTKYFVLVKKTGLKINWYFWNRTEVKLLFSFSVWVFLISLAQRFRLSLVNTILGIFANSREIAIFAIGMMIEGLIWNFSSALNGLFLPKVSRMKQTDNKEAIMKLMIKVGRIQLFIISFLFSGFVVFGRQFISLWVGSEFGKVYLVVIFLTITNIVSLTQHIASDVVYAEGKVNYTGKAIFLTSIIGLAGSCFLARDWGAIGCAACSGLGLFFYVVWVNFFYKNDLGIDVCRFFRECHGKILPFLSLFAVIAFVVTNNIIINSWMILLLIVGIYCMLFWFVSYAIMNNEEKNMVQRFIKK